MAARILNPAVVAETIRNDLRREIEREGAPLTLVGLLFEGHAPSETYAEYTRKGCEDVGIRFELRPVRAADAEDAVRTASADPNVHGVLVYYPVLGAAGDAWLRELVDPRKDIEGLHSFWTRCLYENRRFIDAAKSRKAILPCTPLAILKLLEAAGASRAGSEQPLGGLRACVFNRSEVVGSPLAAMMANDGAEVASFDVDGAELFVPRPGRAHDRRGTSLARAEALATADIVITGVPSRTFPLITGAEIKPGAVCLNFSTLKNFEESILERASVFIPRVGPMTVTMALRNTLRLSRDYMRVSRSSS